MMHLLSLQLADRGISPTRWQWQQHPAAYREKIAVVHDGIDTLRIQPDAHATFHLDSGQELRFGDEVVTYVARNLEPYRGFPTFMRAAKLILKRRPRCHLLIVGGDGVSYGKRPEKGGTYRQQLLDEVDVDLSRVHFLGKVPYERYLQVLQVSAAHIYLTVPFVLSWSALEAMAAGCLIIGSNTPPVLEIVKDRKTGLIVDFFSPEQVADRVDEVFAHPTRLQELRDAARQLVVRNYALDVCLKRQAKLVEELVNETGSARGKVASLGDRPRATAAVRFGETANHRSKRRRGGKKS